MKDCRLLLGTLVTLVAMCVFACRPETAQPVYTFGVAAPFTGQEGAPVYGKNIRSGVELAVSEINAAGGVRGRRLKPVYEDDQLLAPVAVAAIQKLVTVQGVKVVIGPVASSSTLAAVEVANSAPVLLISPASTSHEISGVSPNVFRTIAPDTYEGEAMAEFASRQRYRRVGVAFVDNAGTRGPAEVFRKAIGGLGGEVVVFEVVPQGSTDARVQVTKLLGQQPDAVYLLGYALELGSMLKQVREQNLAIPILSFQVMEEPKVREIAGPAAEGVIFTSPTIYSEFATGPAKKFIENYRARWKEEPGIFAANAYDAVYVMVKAISDRGFEIGEIREGLLAIRGYEGASGTFDINSRGDSNQQPRFLTIKTGRIVNLEEN